LNAAWKRVQSQSTHAMKALKESPVTQDLEARAQSAAKRVSTEVADVWTNAQLLSISKAPVVSFDPPKRRADGDAEVTFHFRKHPSSRSPIDYGFLVSEYILGNAVKGGGLTHSGWADNTDGSGTVRGPANEIVDFIDWLQKQPVASEQTR